MEKRVVSFMIIVSLLMVMVGFIMGYTLFNSQPSVENKSVTVIDDLGRTISLDKPATRIISLASAATYTLYKLGAFDSVIGVDKYSDDPPEAQNKTIVDYKNAEQIISLNPDLIVAWWYQKTYLENLESNISIIYIHPTSVDGIYYDILLLGKVVGKEDKALEIIGNLKARVAYIQDVVKNLTKTYEKPKVYLELYSAYKTVGRDTFTSDMIEIAGGINIAGNLTGYPQLSDEYIIQANPDVILYENSALSPDDFANRTGWDQINAVKENKIYYLDRHIATASPRFIEGLEFMVYVFYGYNVTQSPDYAKLISNQEYANAQIDANMYKNNNFITIIVENIMLIKDLTI